MNITFLIGNGFDLNVGLETTYSSFLKEYTVINETDSDLIKLFKTSILKDAKMWSNAEKAFGVATKEFKEKGYNAEDYCLCHEDFCVKLADYLLNEEQKLNYTALNGILSKGFSNGIRSYKKGFREAEMNSIITAENGCGGEFVFNFINFNYTSVLGLCFESVRTKSGLLGSRTINGRSYTNRLGKVLHVHGTVHKDMVLGVNDITQIEEPLLFEGYDEEYISEIIKQKTNEINEENSDKKAFELLKTSDLIYIYGMSTGETDKLWWDRICKMMARNSNLHLIIHKFDAPDDGLIRRAYRLFVNNIRRDFTSYSGLDDESRKNIEKRIHIDKSNIFDELNNLVENPANTPKTAETITV